MEYESLNWPLMTVKNPTIIFQNLYRIVINMGQFKIYGNMKT